MTDEKKKLSLPDLEAKAKELTQQDNELTKIVRENTDKRTEIRKELRSIMGKISTIKVNESLNGESKNPA